MSLKVVVNPATGRRVYRVQIDGEEYEFEDEPEKQPLPPTQPIGDEDDEDLFFSSSSKTPGPQTSTPSPQTLKRRRAPEPDPLHEDQCAFAPDRAADGVKNKKLRQLLRQKTVVECVERTLRMGMYRALQPLYSFVGKVEVALGGDDVRRHYRWIGKDATLKQRQTPVVSGNKTLTELWENNLHLGPRILASAVAVAAAEYKDDGKREKKRRTLLKREPEFKVPEAAYTPKEEEKEKEEETDFAQWEPYIPAAQTKPEAEDDYSALFEQDVDETEDVKLESLMRRIEAMALGNRRQRFRLGSNTYAHAPEWKRIGANSDFSTGVSEAEDQDQPPREEENDIPEAEEFNIEEETLALLPVKARDLDVLTALIGNEQALMHPDWIQSVIDSSIFRFVLSNTSFGAFELAAVELGRLDNFKNIDPEDLVIDLILSPKVSDMFAEFVANKFLTASGGNAYPSRIYGFGNSGFNARYNISAGFRTRAERSRWNMGAKIWFENVRYVTNPKPREIPDTRFDEEQLDRFLAFKESLKTKMARKLREIKRQLQLIYPIQNPDGETPLRIDPVTELPIVTDTFRSLAGGRDQDRNRMMARRQVIRLTQEGRSIFNALFKYQLNIFRTKMRLAEAQRKYEAYRPNIFVYNFVPQQSKLLHY